jgi:hypothetical protein
MVAMACEAMDLIYVANSDERSRTETIVRFLQVFGGIRSRICLLAEVGSLSPRQSVSLMRLADKIGRQATGWRNASQRQNRRDTVNAGVQP